MKFSPYERDLYGCVNCLPHLSTGSHEHQSTRLDLKKPKQGGPILLEIRRLESVVQDDVDGKSGVRLCSRLVGFSRGSSAPSFAGVASTSLSFRPTLTHSHDQNSSSSRPHPKILVATSLTTGALCIHSVPLKDDFTAPSPSTVTYYPYRHHRPGSSVSWRPHHGHVAIGLHLLRKNRGGDRDFGCLVWDAEHSHSPMKHRSSSYSPAFKFALGSGVSSLCWWNNGQILTVGCQMKNLQLYDLRVSGTNAPPVSTQAHTDAVNGIELDPNRGNVLATFSRGIAEPVKLWDARRVEQPIGEIKTQSFNMTNRDDRPIVSAIAWSTDCPGTLAVAMGETIRHFDTTQGARPVLTNVNHATEAVQCMAFQPKPKAAVHQKKIQRPQLYPQKILVVGFDGKVEDIPNFQIAPLAISSRDGRVAHSLGSTVWVGVTYQGASAMESKKYTPAEDISATMCRRARCLHINRYSTDASSNLQMISEESDLEDPSREELWRLWSWIERVEYLSEQEEVEDWTAKGLMDAGVMKLLKMDDAQKKNKEDDYHLLDVVTYLESLGCDTYDSPLRRAALTACGWTSKFGLPEVLADCEANGHFERSAALAVFHGEMSTAVTALQRGADIRLKLVSEGQQHQDDEFFSSHYVESLQLVAMCIAGYSGTNNTAPVWRSACEGLLQRSVFSSNGGGGKKTHVAYLRAVCVFLCNVGQKDGFETILHDDTLSLCDRVAFACRFLNRNDLRKYLDKCEKQCLTQGNVEGILITGVDKEGIGLLQSYVDLYSDVQTAALVSSRVILPMDWVQERIVCSEWLDSYRGLLNTWQMWQSRATFDVGRAELMRRLKSKKTEPQRTRQSYNYNPLKKQQSGAAAKQTDMAMADSIPTFPPQLYARCNYCNASLPLSVLRRQEGVANSWLSRQKPVLSCCPQCRKPLPRCAICLLPLGCLNPYLELKRERNRLARGTNAANPPDDLSGLANLPFAEWFTWCMRCKHGGHAHHLVGWFANHDTCAVSWCDCRCQFDGVQNLNRPALAKKGNGIG